MPSNTNKNLQLAISQEYPKKVIPLLKNARKSLKIIVYDWRWYPNHKGSSIQLFNNEIVRAFNRGVDVKAVIKPSEISNKLRELDIDHTPPQSRKTLHTKLLIVDNEKAVLGSHNFTLNAFNINHEVSVIISDQKIVDRLIKYFQNLWGP